MFSPVFTHRATVGTDLEGNSPVFGHRFIGGSLEGASPTYAHRFTGGSVESFGPVFSHEALVDPLDRVKGEQLEPILRLPRTLEVPNGGETSATPGHVRFYAEDDTPRFVNAMGEVFRLDLDAVPLGGIIAWWPSVANDNPPENFEFCDGTAVTTEGSPYQGRFKPSIMRTDDAPGAPLRFPRGADYTQPYGGNNPFTNAGSDTHAHGGTALEAGDHEHDAGDHIHGIATEADHNHGNVLGSADGLTSGAIVIGAQAIGDILINDVDGPDVTDDEVFHQHAIGLDGGHDHTGFTTVGSGSTETAGAHVHIIQTDTVEAVPAHVQLAWIVRVL